MLGVGWTEMLVIGVVALIVIGPKELPALMHRLGKFTATIRRMGSDFQKEINKTTGLDEVRNLRNSITAPLKATTDAIRKEFNATSSTGAVTPTGALKPTDPKVESVVDSIHAAAGMTPPTTQVDATKDAMKQAMLNQSAATKAKAAAAAATAAPVKAKRIVKKVPPSKPVTVADLPPAAAKRTPAKKKVESPAPIEAIAPAKKPAAKTGAAAKTVPAAKAATPAKRKAAPAAKKA